jgi:hypothetical protein
MTPNFPRAQIIHAGRRSHLGKRQSLPAGMLTEPTHAGRLSKARRPRQRATEQTEAKDPPGGRACLLGTQRAQDPALIALFRLIHGHPRSAFFIRSKWSH